MTRLSQKARRRRIRPGLTRAAVDLLAVGLAFTVSHLVHLAVVESGTPGSGLTHWGHSAGAALVFALLLVLVFARLGLYRPDTSWLNIREFEGAVRGSVIAGGLFLALAFFSDQSTFSRLHVGLSVVMAMATVVLVRRLTRGTLGVGRSPGTGARRVLLFGAGDAGRLLMKKVVHSVYTDRRIIGFLDDAAPIGGVVSCRLDSRTDTTFEAPVLGRFEDLSDIARDHEIDELLVTTALEPPERLAEITRFCHREGIAVGLIPRFGPLRIDQLETQEIGAVPVLRPMVGSRKHIYTFSKRVLDLLLAGVLLVLTAPLWLLAAVLIRWDSPGPVLFRQDRVGHRGVFRMVKFRTMRIEADPYAFSPASSDDPRLTGVGRMIRRAGLDELPQLLNVLRGEMSLVGPRPEMPFIVERYSELEALRLSVPAGITGLWQLSADRGVHIHENIEYDLYYVYNRSFMLDLIILMESVLFVMAALMPLQARRTRNGGTESSGAESGQPSGGSSGSLKVDGGARVAGEIRLLHAEGGGNGREDGYLLVALDQRQTRRRIHWRRALPAAYRTSSEWRVKLLVADENRREVDLLLDEEVRLWGTNGFRVEFTRYVSGERLRSLMNGAGAVLTDLPHVVEWADEDGVEVLALEGSAVRKGASPGEGSRLARRVLELLSASAVSAEADPVPSTGWAR